MYKNLIRRVERLEQTGRPAFQTKLRAVARNLGFNEEGILGIAKGHERELTGALGEGGLITWEGFVLLYRLYRQADGLPEPESGDYG
jgi:hypothetical protein